MIRRLRRATTLPLALYRDPRERYRLRARFAAARHRLIWVWRRFVLKRQDRERPIIAIGLVGHLGDIVAAEPVARYLRREHPHAYLVWAVEDRYRELVEHHPSLDAILPLGCLTEWIHLAGSRAFDQVVDLHVQGRDCALCKQPLFKSGGDRGINFDTYYTFGNLLHVFCRTAELPPLDERPRLHVPDAVRQRVDGLSLPSTYVVIHCTSNEQERDWTAAKWQELTERIVASTALAVVEVGLRPVVRDSLPGYVDLCGTLSVLETAEVLRRAEAFVGIDSGPAHLANAVATPGVILLGHYGPYLRRMPYSGGYADGSNATVIHWEGPSAEIPVERVLEAMRLRLGAAPYLNQTGSHADLRGG